MTRARRTTINSDAEGFQLAVCADGEGSGRGARFPDSPQSEGHLDGATNRFVVAQGSVGDAQTAFNVKINRAMVKGAVHRVSSSKASVAGAAGTLVSAVQGLSDLGYRTHVSPALDPETGTAYAGVAPSAVGADGLFYSADCLRTPETQTFTTGGGYPEAVYTGNRYGANITNVTAPNLPPCGYDAAEMQSAYGLGSLYARGLNGAGQTIVIVDAYGSNSIVSDTNLFSQLNGLPALTAANFQIVTPSGPVNCAAACQAGNWQFETTLDVQWAHSIAPGAKIVLVLAQSNSFLDLDIANLYAIQNHLGNVVSNSFGISEVALVVFDPSELTVENQIAEIAAAMGISQNVSSGDSGDNLAVDQSDYGIDSVSVGANADSPYVTAVGGTSTFLDSKNNIKLQTGWGLNFSRIADPTPNPPTLPPLFFGFQFGIGGRHQLCLRQTCIPERPQRELPPGSGHLNECGPADGQRDHRLARRQSGSWNVCGGVRGHKPLVPDVLRFLGDRIMRLGVTVGQGCTALMDAKMRNLSCQRLELDEIWGFVGKKERSVRVGDSPEVGSVWTFCAIDADTKLVPAFKVGERNPATTQAFVKDVAERMAYRVQVSTDSLRHYVAAMDKAFGTEVDYAQIIKVYGKEQTDDRRYSPRGVISSQKLIYTGNPNEDLISTSYVER